MVLVLTSGLTALLWNSYGECLRAFFHFDDFWVLGAAARIERELPWGVWRIFQPVHGFLLYRPLSTVGYFLGLRLLFGNDPAAFHAVQLAFQVVNSLLVYALALILFRQQLLAIVASIAYATAPALAIAACWNSLFTVTGAAFFSFLALLAWTGWRGPLGAAATCACFAAALLASEHGVTLSLALAAAAVFLRVRAEERYRWVVLGGMLSVSAAYVLAKVLYLHFGLEADFPDPAARAFILQGYAPEWSVSVALASFGTYLGYAFAPLFWLARASSTVRVVAGVLLLAAAALAAVACVRGWGAHGSARLIGFGITWFLAAVLPVAFLPRHVASYYGSIGACGIALAAAAVVRACRMRWRGVAAAGLAVSILGIFFTVRSQALQSDEFAFFRNFTWAAERWLRSISEVARGADVDRIAVPDSVLSQLVFVQGRAHEVLLCSHIDVEVVPKGDSAPAGPRRIFLGEPFWYPREELSHRPWLPKRCRE